MVAALKQLTRQQLADMLLQQMQQQQQQCRTVNNVTAGLITGPALPVSKTAPQQQQQLTAITKATSSSVTACSSSSCLLVPSSSSERQWRQHAELREAMFQLVKAAQQQQQAAGLTSGRQSLNRYQALLLRWLKADSSSSSSSSGGRASPAAAVMRVKVLLLHAQLAVKVKRWQVAQEAATAAEKELKIMVSSVLYSIVLFACGLRFVPMLVCERARQCC
jgi:hypothetical protein